MRLFAPLLLAAAALVAADKAALRDGEAALAEARSLGERTDEASHRAAAELFLKARSLLRGERKPKLEAAAIEGLATVYYLLEDSEHALAAYRELETLARQLHDRRCETSAAMGLGDVALFLKRDFPEAAANYRRAAGLANRTRDRKPRAQALYKLGLSLWYRNEPRQALEPLRSALAIDRAIKDPDAAVQVLLVLGRCHDLLSGYESAARSLEEAVHLLRANPPPPPDTSLAQALNNLGADYRYLGRYEAALQCLREAEDLYGKQGAPQLATGALLNIGEVLALLGDQNAAAQALQRAQDEYHKSGNVAGEAAAANNLAGVYVNRKQPQKALVLYREVLGMVEAKRPVEEGKTLNNIGHVYARMGDPERALESYRQALRILHAAGDRRSEAIALNNIGAAYQRLGKAEQAILYEESALAILREVKDRSGEAGALVNLMNAWQRQGHPEIAVLCGKEAVQLYQKIRAVSSGLPLELKRSYLSGVAPAYRALADLLIGLGRLPEAEQALRLLKEDEFDDFTRRGGSAPQGAGLASTPAESACSNEGGAGLMEIGRRWGELQTKAGRTAPEDRELDSYVSQLEEGNVRFQKCLGALHSETNPASPAAGQLAQVEQQSESIMRSLAKLGAGTVAIYTVSGEQAFSAMLVTADARQAYRHAVSAEALSRKILDFRAAITERSPAVKQIGHDLFDIVIGPELKEDLRRVKAETIMWSLDGNLRYVPMAALFDGERFLVEDYRLAVFTPASLESLREPPSRNWKAAAFGVTRQYGKFPALPAVAGELHGIVKETGTPGGVLPGAVWLDDQFTEGSLRKAFLRNYTILHIATHFNFEPGDGERSFLLLGDGASLSLNKFSALPGYRNNMDLLTLSACNTAMGGGGEGKEIESFGVEAQKKWARAVLASLWEVADEGAAVFMRNFYQRREADPPLSKAEALRQTQIAMLRGEIKSGAGEQRRGVAVNRKESAPPDDFRHPFYWAPFFLMGNWL